MILQIVRAGVLDHLDLVDGQKSDVVDCYRKIVHGAGRLSLGPLLDTIAVLEVLDIVLEPHGLEDRSVRVEIDENLAVVPPVRVLLLSLLPLVHVELRNLVGQPVPAITIELLDQFLRAVWYLDHRQHDHSCPVSDTACAPTTPGDNRAARMSSTSRTPASVIW